jgi:prefoldin subunit 5|tara:strand:+ start:383 stop:694 length:312 start_codon:yes stop_codon:yes gene_type:complete
MDRELINKSREILDRDILDMEEQQVLNEISIGKLSSTVFLGRLKVLTNKIKDTTMKKTLMNLGYMVYTVSLQSKSLKNIEDTLSKLNQTIQNQQREIQRLNKK